MTTYYDQMIEVASKQHSLDPKLVKAVCIQESGLTADAFRFEPAFWEKYLKDKTEYHGAEPRRVSSSYGLMQVMYPTARDAGFTGQPETLFQPELNLYWGCGILDELAAWAHNTKTMLAAYNAGKGGIDSQAGLVYAAAVLAHLAQL